MDTDEKVTRRYRKKVYVGRSQASGRKKPSFEEALQHAYDQAPKPKKPASGEAPKPTRYRVLDIWAVGTNPLSEYIVAIEAES
jgi:hypothetical protein